MCSSVLLLVAIVVLQIHANMGQLGNSTFSAEDILDAYEPSIIRGNTTRIVGGKRINIRQVPWQIALSKNGFFICGGSIISEDWVLTAAHCIRSGGEFSVRAGSPNYRDGGEIRDVETVVINGAYNFNTMNYDIAMLRVRSPFVWKSKVRAVTLAKSSRRLPSRYFVTGWGTQKEDGNPPIHLRGVSIKKVRRSVCRRKYSVDNIPITKKMMCAALPGKDSCQGDSGGPLVHKNIQYGIVSFGVGCARPHFPGVYTNLRKQNKWIRKVIRRHGGQRPTFG